MKKEIKKIKSKKIIKSKKNENVKKDMNKSKKAQVSLEMIIIIGVLILGAVILATILIGFTNEKVDQAGEIDAATNSTIDGFIKDLTNPEDYEPISGVGSNCVLTLSSNPPAGGTVSGAGTFSCGTSVTASATALSGYTFNNWTTPTGSLSTNPYTFNLNSNTSLIANFSSTAPSTYTLNVARAGAGNGTVTSSNPGINCGSDCSENYSSGTSVTLTANPVTGHSFGGWSGACSGTNLTCTVSMTQARNVTATFNLPATYTLSLVENPDEPYSTLVGAGNYSVGTVVPISINSRGPIVFINWTNQSGTIVSTESSFNYTMPSSNTTLYANFSTVAEFCPESISYNGDTYKLSQIGGQCWFVENLKTRKYKDGSNILTSLDPISWSTTTSGAYDVYDYTHSYANDIESSSEMISTYGLLYNWYAVDDARGLCPDDFRVATDADFEGLKYFVNFTTREDLPARHLKTDRTEIGGSVACNPTNVHPRFLFPFNSSQCGLDTFGFSAIPSGYLDFRKESDLLGVASYFWIDGHNSPNYADHYSTTYYRTDFTNWGLIEKNIGLSVRCVKGGNLPTAYDLNYSLDVLRNNDLLGSVTGSGNVIAGTNVTVTATPISGSNFLNWTNSQNEVLSTNSSYTFKMPYRYYTIKANFSPVPSYPIEITLNDPTNNQQFPPYYTHPTDGTGIRLAASISGSDASNSEFMKYWQYSRDNINWSGITSGNFGNSSSAYGLYIPSDTGIYYFRLRYTDTDYPGIDFYSNIVQVNVISLP